MKSFENFLKDISTVRRQYRCTEKEVILIERKTEDMAVGKYCPRISIIGYGKSDGAIIITLKMRVNNRENEVVVTVTEGRTKLKIKVDVEDILECYSWKWIYHKQELLNLVYRYISYVVEEYINENYHIYAKCGWQEIQGIYQYKSVTYRNLSDATNIQDMFGRSKYHRQIDNAISLRAHCKEFLQFLQSNKNLVGIYAYTIHSLLWDFHYRYRFEKYYEAVLFAENTDMVFFSACIHGKDTTKAKVIANILSNLFQEPSRDWGTILTSGHHISATSVDDKIDRLKYYSSVPIIVTAKSNRILKTSKIVKEMHRGRKSGKLFIYPLYISDTPINVDEMVNFPVDNIELSFSAKDKEYISNIHHGALELLYYFLCFLRDLDERVEKDWNTWYAIKKSICEDITVAVHELGMSEEQNAGWLYDNLSLFLLYVALRDFCLFLKQIGLGEDAEQLKQIYKDGFLVRDGVDNSMPENTDKTMQASNQAQQYLECMSKLINSAIKQKADWLIVGNEPRGNKEKCYYLKENEWYEHFSSVIQKKNYEPISKRNMVALLKKQHLLKMQKNSSANGVKRNGVYYLAVLADEFNQLIQQ